MLTLLTDRVIAAFEAGGPLSAGASGMERREGQIRMAVAVADAIESGACLVAEGGTGVGKTLAYLVPLLLSGRRAVLSTSTHLLQHQLAQRDIPDLARLMGLPVRAIALKGRSHYLCNHRLQQVLRSGAGAAGADPRTSAALATIQRWALETCTGEFAELGIEGVRSAWRVRLGSTSETCLGNGCPSFNECHFRRARMDAESAEWLVVNHHLFFAEMLAEPDGGPAWLQDRQGVVFDEAHRLPEIGRDMLGRSVGQHRLLHWARDLAELGPLAARGMGPWAYLAMQIQRAVKAVSALRPADLRSGLRNAWVDGSPAGVARAPWLNAIVALNDSLAAAHQALLGVAETSIDLRHLLGVLERMATDWRGLLREQDADGYPAAQWMQWGDEGGDEGGSDSGWRIVRAPVHGAGGLALWMQKPQRANTAWVFTSATLGHDQELSWFVRQMALKTAPKLRVARYPSPFDWLAQLALFVPMDSPEPSDPAHSLDLADRVADWSTRLGGRTLVLTTTVKAARRIAHRLRWRLGALWPCQMEVLDETQGSREAVLGRFRQIAAAQDAGIQGNNPTHAGAVLVGSMGFWEGVDLAGDVLQLVVIDKLPFPSPDDPMIQARIEACEREGLDAFQQVLVADAALGLRQGVGRLIRSPLDQGVVVLADARVVKRSYGSQLMQALPTHRRLMGQAELSAELERLKLTRVSTRDRWISGNPG